MNKKQIIILAVIFGALLLGIGIKTLFQSLDFMTVKSKQMKVPSTFTFEPTQVEKILLGRGVTPPVELMKQNGVWKVKSLWDAKANKTKIYDLLKKLSSIQGELRGSGKNLFPDFGIMEPESFSIKLIGAGNVPILDLRVGLKKAGSNGYFIRKAGSENVFLAEVNMAELLGIYTALEEAHPQSDFWADTALFDLKPENVKQIVVRHMKVGVQTMVAGAVLEKDKKDPSKSTWEFIQPGGTFQPDPDKILRFIAALNSIQAQKVVNPNGVGYGLDKPVWELAVTEGNPPEKQDETRPSSQGGKEIILSAGPKNEKEDVYFVKIAGDPTIFQLSGHYFEDLDVTLERLSVSKDTTPPAGSAKPS